MDKVNYYLAQLDKELTKIPVAVEIEKRTKVPKAYIAGGLGAVTFILIFLNFWGNFLTTIIGPLPIFQGHRVYQQDDDRQWLTYWTVFGMLNILEFFPTFSSTVRIPFYYVFKAGAILYLILPQTRGATVVYNTVLRPYLLKKESSIDEGISKIRTSAVSAAGDLAEKRE
ncbi:receptor accessory protein 5 [Chytridium lagenaria]|nr:receptor accessory protein 5 [Chytridium lagenaria]